MTDVRQTTRPENSFPRDSGASIKRDKALGGKAREFGRFCFIAALATVSLTVEQFRYTSAAITVSDFFLIAACVFALSVPRAPRQALVNISILGGMIYCAGLVITAFAAANTAEILVFAVKFAIATFLPMWAAGRLLRTRDDLRSAIMALVSGAALNGVLGMVQMKIGHIFFIPTPNFWGRFAGLSEHPNELGPICAIGATMALYEGITETSLKRKGLCAGLLFCCLCGVLASASMTAAIGLGIGVVCCLTLGRRPFVAMYSLGALAIGGVILFAEIQNTTMTGNGIFSRLARLAYSGSNYDTALSRTSVYEASFQEIMTNPLVGHLHDSPFLPHNFVIYAWWSAGILGLIGCLMLVGFLFLALLQRLSNSVVNSRSLDLAMLSAFAVLILELSLSPPAARRSTWCMLWIAAVYGAALPAQRQMGKSAYAKLAAQ